MFTAAARTRSIALSAAGFALVAVLHPAFAQQAAGQGNQSQPVATQTSKQQREKVCRARYDDCIKIKQLPPYQCNWIYNDCLANMI